jgi:hypothetical protein
MRGRIPLPADDLLLSTRTVTRPTLYWLLLNVFLPFVDWSLARKMLTGIKHEADS